MNLYRVYAIGIASLLLSVLAICGAAVWVPVYGSEAPVTFNRQIAPILYRNCTTCHHPNGGGPFSLLTFEDARRRGPQIAAVTGSRYMPPWLPEHGYGDFDGERRLSDEEIALIRKWFSTGMARGNDRDAPAPPHYDDTWALGKPDLVLSVEQPSGLPSSGSDVFLNFVLPYPLKEAHFIRAVEIRPTTPQVVHHANILIDRTASWRREHPDNWREAIPGMGLIIDAGGTFDPDSHFLFWKPDTPALVEPEDMSWRLDPGNDLILNMHLKPSGKPETVAAQIGLYFADVAPSKQPVLLQLEHDSALDIPPGAREFVVEDELTLPVDVDLLGIYPHAHYLGKDLQGYAILPDGRKIWLIWIRNWDIDRQSVYRYRKPVFLPKGATIHMHYIYDNSRVNVHNPSDPPVRVRAGNRSVDEMGHLWLQVLPVRYSPEDPDPRLLLEEAWMQSRLRKQPHDTLALYNLAAALTSEGKNTEGIRTYKQLTALNPKDARAWNGLGVALENNGDWMSALQSFQRASDADPTMVDAIFNRAKTQLEHSEAAEAEKSFRDVLKQAPNDASAHSGRGQALLKEGREREAKADFMTALTLDSQDIAALEGLGQLAIAGGAPGEAVVFLERAKQAGTEDPTTWEDLGIAYAQLDRFDEATRALQHALHLSPHDAQIHAALSQVYSASGQLLQAIVEQQEALRLGPDNADGWNDLGVLEARTGNLVMARQDFEHALRIAPGHASAKANLARLAADAKRP